MSGGTTPWWEKSGNTAWVRCGACGGWFHASEELLSAADAILHCPHCHAEFAPEAARVERP